MRNVTLSADDKLIEKARQRAVHNGTTLNNEFRVWLTDYTTSGQEAVAKYDKLMKRLKAKGVNAGRKFSREEMNARR